MNDNECEEMGDENDEMIETDSCISVNIIESENESENDSENELFEAISIESENESENELFETISIKYLSDDEPIYECEYEMNDEGINAMNDITPLCESHQSECNMENYSEEPNEDNVSGNISNTNKTSCDHTGKIHGPRIVNVEKLFLFFKKINEHNLLKGCSLRDIEIISERRNGFNSVLTFKCSKCCYGARTETSPSSATMPDINYNAVLGSTLAGIGFSQLQEVFANMDIPCMSQPTYDVKQTRVFQDMSATVKHCMMEAVEEEKLAAIQSNNVDENGTPLVTVVVDGTWSKRSYGTNYSALSGGAAIISADTKKVLWAGVKNKYCQICSLAETKQTEARDHNCYKNYKGSSTGMESELILDGFAKSEAEYGIRYSKFIGDGDSSTHKKLLEARIYKNPDIKIEKIECVLHLFRNFRKKMLSLQSLKEYGRHKTLVSATKIEDMVKGVRAAAKHWMESEEEWTSKIRNLQQDIRNAPYHVFGQHDKCATYFCNKTNDQNVTSLLKSTDLFDRIITIFDRLVLNAKSLLLNKNSNIVESFNGSVAKYIGGKRVNYSGRSSYECRYYAAIIQHNTSAVASTIHKFIYANSSYCHVSIMEERRKKKKIYTQQNKKWKPKNKSGADKDYGEECQQEDITGDALEVLKDRFLEQLKKKQQRREQIQLETIGQAENPAWFNAKSGLLTASVFGKVCRAKSQSSYANIVNNYLYKQLTGIKAIEHGRINESKAVAKFEEISGLVVQNCGLFIDDILSIVGATPDGVVDNDAIVEVKCPYSAFKMSVEDAIRQRKITFWQVERKNKKSNQLPKILGLNKKHHWYYQVQGQLHITKRKKCFFVVWCGDGHDQMRVEEIERDDNFWKNEMEPKLLKFYMEALLPELVDSRKSRNMPLR